MDVNRAFSPENARAILVVDDDVQVLKGLCRMLFSIGCLRILPASSPSEAIEIWRENSECIDTVISDFVMPELTGDQLALRLRSDKPGLKVLFISGNDPGSLESAIPLESGENFLQKPFTVRDMKRYVENFAMAAPAS